MTKKCPKWKQDAVGQFLIELEDRGVVSAANGWRIAKPIAREEFKKFLEKAKNVNLIGRFKSRDVNDVGSLLRLSNYLIDVPRNSEIYHINNVTLASYRKELEITTIIAKSVTVGGNDGSKKWRLPYTNPFVTINLLPRYVPPSDMYQAMLKKFSNEILCSSFKYFDDYFEKGQQLTNQNMANILRTLLFIEDVEQTRTYHKLTHRNVKIQQIGKRYQLQLSPNGEYDDMLSQFTKLLIVTESDTIKKLKKDFILEFMIKDEDDFVTPSAISNSSFVGQIIEKSEGNKLYFECDGDLDVNVTYLVLFKPWRQTFRYQYRAIELLEKMPKTLINNNFFPSKRDLPQLSCETNFKNNKNPEHTQAILNITSSQANESSPPFIIFGPPGTGKTTVVVNAISELWKKNPNVRILVTSGSNSACDEIALRICSNLNLFEEPRSNIIARIYCRTQEERKFNIEPPLREYSNLYSWHFFPAVDVLHKYPIVICTLSVVAKLISGNFGVDSILTHIFVDEAAASTEPETYMGLCGTLLSKRTKLILSGDHHQLGAIVRSKHAVRLGLDKSLMERLLESDCYRIDKDGNYDHSVQTRLCRNYRSHPEIVKLYNHKYYNNTIIAEAKGDILTLCEKWPNAPNPNYPIVFHSVSGKQEKQRNTKSLYNEEEQNVVMSYVKQFLELEIKGRKITQEDIGIISPYKSQYMFIQERLNALGYFNIKAGSPETFRGVEKTIIITSFVRSKGKGMAFLDNAKRLNVILSRAKSLLILVGNAKALCSMRDYKYVIWNCQKNNTLIGEKYSVEYNEEAADVDTVAETLDSLNLNAEMPTTSKHIDANRTK